MLLQDYNNKNLSFYKNFLDENHAIPLYYQLELIIQNYIDVEDITPGSVFFSEEEISEQLDISRPTANKAIKSLIEKGYLSRSRCKRSIVNKINRVPLVFLQELGSFGEILKKQDGNYSYNTVLMDRKIIKPNNKIVEYLNLKESEDVIFIKRLRYINQEPLIIVDSFLSYNDYSELLEVPAEDFSKDLYFLMKELFGVSVYKTDREITATRMSLEDAALLDVEIWEPCLKVLAVSYTEDEIPFECFNSRFKGSSCVLKTSLSKR